ncbi:MAG: hypothetical protein QXL82_00310 [Candidatus Aenigmatarchaeota archaeon]
MEAWKLHAILHIIIPIIVFSLSFIYIQELSLLERFIAIFLGSLIPDIDHLIYLKYIRFRNFKEFLLFNIKSDRYRRGFLLFHNFIFISILAVSIPIIMFFSIFWALFFLAFLIHLIFDFFEDRILIRATSYWKFGK